MGLPAPFWAFAWAGGQALARYILDHPDTEDFGPTLEDVILGECHESVLAEELDDYLIETLL